MKKKISLILMGILAIGFFAYRSYLKRNPTNKNLEEERDFVDQVENIATAGPLEPESEYEGNNLKDGDSPFDVLYGKGAYSKADNSLVIKNEGNTDVVVFLVSVDEDKVLRNEYINGNSSFEMTNIPNSTCYVKYYYGRNWNPTRKTKNVLTGGFDNGEQHVISDNPSDILTFKEEIRGDYVYSSQFEVTLETIITEGTTMSEERISAIEFF